MWQLFSWFPVNVQLLFGKLSWNFEVHSEGRLHWTSGTSTGILNSQNSHSVLFHTVSKSQREISQITIIECHTHQDAELFTPMRLSRKLETSLGLPGWKGVRLKPLVLNISNAWKQRFKTKFSFTRLVFITHFSSTSTRLSPQMRWPSSASLPASSIWKMR